MSTETMIALFATVVSGMATAAAAMINHEANASLAALAPQDDPAAVYPQHRVRYDNSGAAIFRGQLTRAGPLSLKQQSRL